jgi:enoyl-CoA hydratase/carnithine racemase
MTQDTLIVDPPVDGVLAVTLNRPEKLNAFDFDMMRRFRDLWADVRGDAEVRCVVLRANGDRAFCAGIDPDGGFRDGDARSRERPFELGDPGEWLGPKQNRVWKPVICAIQGICAGGGFYFLNECDIAICSEEATFFDPHVSHSRVPAVEPVGLLARIPLAEVQRLALMGADERISAATALRISLVTEVTPRADLWRRAHEIAAAIARKHPVAVQGAVRAVWEGLSLPHAEAVANALKYGLIGNPIARADPAFVPPPRVEPKLR